MLKFYGITFNEKLTTPCSVTNCYFFYINDRTLFFDSTDILKCAIVGCLFINVGISDPSIDGGVIFFSSENSAFDIIESVFDASPSVNHGIIAIITSKYTNSSFLDINMNKEVGEGHMAMSFINQAGSIKYLNFSKIFSRDNAGLQIENGIYKAKFIQTVHSNGLVLFRAAIDKNSVLSKFIFANCKPTRGIFSLYYGEYSMKDAVFSNTSAPIIYAGHILEGYDCYLITLINPVFHSFESIQSHPSLIIQSLSSVSNDPTIITRFVMMRRNVGSECRCFGGIKKLREMKNILMTFFFFALIDINCKADD